MSNTSKLLNAKQSNTSKQNNDSSYYLKPSISYTSQGSIDFNINYFQPNNNAKPQAENKSKHTYAICNIPTSIYIGNKVLQIRTTTINYTRDEVKYHTEGTQCGQIFLLKNKVKIVKDSDQSNNDDSNLSQTSNSPSFGCNTSQRQRNHIEDISVKGTYQCNICTQPLTSHAPTKQNKAFCRRTSSKGRMLFKPLGIYGQTYELGRYPLLKVKNNTKRTKRKRSAETQLPTRYTNSPNAYTMTSIHSPFQVQPSSYVNSNKDTYSKELSKNHKLKPKSPIRNRIIKQRVCSIEEPQAIDWSNSILFYNIKNGDTAFNLNKDEVYQEFEVIFLFDSFKSANDAALHKNKIGRTLSKLCKELCIPWKDEAAYDMFKTAKILFAARKDVISLLSKLSSRELLIIKDIMYMINSEHIDNQALLIQKVNQLFLVDHEILREMELLQQKYIFFDCMFLLGGIDIKLMINIEWKDIVTIMKDVHNISFS